jgi:hypothetical protein
MLSANGGGLLVATWIKCTREQDGVSILLNLDAAISIEEVKKGGTMIAFPGGLADAVHVKETMPDIIEKTGLKHA